MKTFQEFPGPVGTLNNTHGQPVCNAGWDNVTDADDTSTAETRRHKINTERATEWSVYLHQQRTGRVLNGL